MKMLFGGRSAVGLKVAVFALATCIGLTAVANAQAVAPPTALAPQPMPVPPSALPAPLNSLNANQDVIGCTAGPDQSGEAGTGTVNFNGSITTGYVSDPPPVFFWVNMATNQVDEVGPNTSETAPRTNTEFVLVVWDTNSGNWGEATFNFTAADTTPPQIWLLGDPTVFVTCGTPYFEAGYGVFDNADGSNVPVTVTGSVDTNTVGVYTLTYTATDAHNNSASVSRTVDVVYAWSQFAQPVDPLGNSVFHLGSTIPLKFTLTGPCAKLPNINAKLYLAKMTNSIAGTEIVATASGNADNGNLFRFSNGTYMFNLSTKGMSTGTWQLRVDMGDGSIHAGTISLTN